MEEIYPFSKRVILASVVLTALVAICSLAAGNANSEAARYLHELVNQRGPLAYGMLASCFCALIPLAVHARKSQPLSPFWLSSMLAVILLPALFGLLASLQTTGTAWSEASLSMDQIAEDRTVVLASFLNQQARQWDVAFLGALQTISLIMAFINVGKKSVQQALSAYREPAARIPSG